MSLNPKLLKKLADPATVAAAGRKAILEEESISLRIELRSIFPALMSPTTSSIPADCAIMRKVLDELEELDAYIKENSNEEG